MRAAIRWCAGDGVITCGVGAFFLAIATSLSALAADKPTPTKADIAYGPHRHQLLDIHVPPQGAGPFPVLIWFGGLWSPSKGVPDLNFENNWGLTKPETVQEMDYKVHAPQWGLGFQKLTREHGVTCYVKYPDHPSEKYRDMWEFLVEELRASSK